MVETLDSRNQQCIKNLRKIQTLKESGSTKESGNEAEQWKIESVPRINLIGPSLDPENVWDKFGSVWYICLKTENCYLKTFVEIRVGEKMYENTYNVV